MSVICPPCSFVYATRAESLGTGSVKKVMGPEEEKLSATEEEQRMRVLAQTVRTYTPGYLLSYHLSTGVFQLRL